MAEEVTGGFLTASQRAALDAALSAKQEAGEKKQGWAMMVGPRARAPAGGHQHAA